MLKDIEKRRSKHRKPRCPVNPNHVVRRNIPYDAYVCFHCEDWIEDKCSDEECEFCKDRPERPPI